MKECDILGGQKILWLILHIFRGSGPPIPLIYTPAVNGRGHDNLFRKVLGKNHHTLYPLLPPPADNLRQRKHNRSLITKNSALSENNFIIRLLYKSIYWRACCINVCSF